jgi:glutamine synthetase adenylyltransferase
MNITLSAKESLINKAREYVAKHGTTLNALVRRFLEKIVEQEKSDTGLKRFLQLAENYSGDSQS